MSTDEQHVALPKLYGAPAYARPAAPVATTTRPFDPDDLPLDALQTEEERRFAENLPARAWAPGGTSVEGNGHIGSGHDHVGQPTLQPRALRLRSIAGRLLGGN